MALSTVCQGNFENLNLFLRFGLPSSRKRGLFIPRFSQRNLKTLAEKLFENDTSENETRQDSHMISLPRVVLKHKSEVTFLSPVLIVVFSNPSGTCVVWKEPYLLFMRR